MAIETIVSPSPVGASRMLEWWEDEETTQSKNTKGRIGVAQSYWRSDSNRDPAGGGLAVVNGAGNYTGRAGSSQYAQWQGSTMFGPWVFVELIRPSGNFVWPMGRFFFEALLQWDAAPAAGVDSGIAFVTTNHPRVLGSVAETGALVSNVGGNLTFASRGPGGAETVNIQALAGPLNQWNKVRITIRQPTPTRDATLEVAVNDVTAITRTWAAPIRLPVPQVGTSTWGLWEVVHATAASYMHSRNLHCAWGPDLSEL